MKPKEVYRRNLPHINPPGGTFFVTYNLDGSIPKDVLIRLQEEYRSEKEALLNRNMEKNTIIISAKNISILVINI